jgi:hypothetical protein
MEQALDWGVGGGGGVMVALLDRVGGAGGLRGGGWLDVQVVGAVAVVRILCTLGFEAVVGWGRGFWVSGA